MDLLVQVAGQVAIAVENALAFQEIGELKNKLAQEKLYLEDEIRSEMNFDEIVGEGPSLRAVLKQVETVAPTDSTVLITGETGTGKELIARAIHNLSPRRERTFVKVNCAAIPTGPARIGIVRPRARRLYRSDRAAHRPVRARATAARFSSTKSAISRSNCSPSFCASFRNRSLSDWAARTRFAWMSAWWPPPIAISAEMVAARTFRSDLYYRLRVFPLHHAAPARTAGGYSRAGALLR